MNKLRAMSVLLFTSLLATGCGNSETATTTTTVVMQGPELKIMAIGDSITASDRVSGGYRTQLSNELRARGDMATFVGSQTDETAPVGVRNHEGHNGFWIENLDEQAGAWTTAASPNVVLVMAGTNDILNGAVGAAPARLTSLINTIAAANSAATILVSNVAPLRDHSAEVTQFNAAIPGVVSALSAKGVKVLFVDTNSNVQLSDLGDDGIHPETETSYAAMGRAWAPAVHDVFLQSRTGQ